MNNKQMKTYALGFLGIVVFTFVLTKIPDSISGRTEQIENKFNIYISKLSNEEIEANLSKGLKPIAIKDNIDVNGFANTAGSLALKDNYPSNNAFLIQELVDNGYFVIGKTNLSEWANFRSSSSTSGWSSMGGQTINPYGLMRTPCGSSSGSGVVVATGLIDVAIGTETNGSVSCPSSVNGIVGIKPTVGLVSRSGIIPISHTQDTAGPMASSVEKAAEILEIIAGKDINDPATLNIPKDFNFDFTSNLNKGSLKGKRFGLLPTGSSDKDGEKALQKIRVLLESSGAIVVDVEDARQYPTEAELLVLMYEFKVNLEKYLATSNSPFKTLEELIEFNNNNKEEVLKHFDQNIFVDSEKTSSQKEEYLIALQKILNTRNGIDNLLQDNNVDALVGLSWSPAWAINHDGGDDEAIAEYRFWVNGGYAAMAGYPHITIPLDYIDDVPIGMSFIGTAWSDKQLIEYAHSFEQLNNFNPTPTLFHIFKSERAVMFVLLLTIIMVMLNQVKETRISSDSIFLRTIPGLKAVEEAVGRSTEMGRPILYVPGIMDMNEVETVAGVIILGHVAQMTAQYETSLDVPVARSIVMQAARESCKEAYLTQGRPEMFNEDMVHYITDDQFAYAAGVNGIMQRDKPAACMYMGKFYAESLLFAETGNSIGAIQIAGTASQAQIPFFVTACDYTLMGEEYFAASAYLSRKPELIAGVKTQDMVKLMLISFIGVALLSRALFDLGLTSFNLLTWLGL